MIPDYRYALGWGWLLLAHTALAQAPSFAPAATYPTGGTHPIQLAVADLNGEAYKRY